MYMYSVLAIWTCMYNVFGLKELSHWRQSVSVMIWVKGQIMCKGPDNVKCRATQLYVIVIDRL